MVKPKPNAETKLFLAAIRREQVGTSSAQSLRRRGLVPGVVYGKKTEAIPIAVPARDLAKVLHTEAGAHALLTLRIADGSDPAGASGERAGSAWERPVLMKAVAHHPVDGRVTHVDFHAIILTERIRVKVPIGLKGVPVGVKEQGGILEHFLREIEVECLPTRIPAAVEFDVSHLRIGDAVHVQDLPPLAEATITNDPAGVIASVLAPKEEKAEEAAAAAEPEVISEKKTPEGAEAAEGEPAKGEKAEGKTEGKPRTEESSVRGKAEGKKPESK